MKLFTLIALLALLTACSSTQKPYTADLTNVVSQPLTNSSSAKVDRVLVVTMKTAHVPETMTIENSQNMLGGFRPFLEAGIRDAMSPYFTDVVFVGDETVEQAGAHALSKVKVDSVEAESEGEGESRIKNLKMSWTFELRLPEYKTPLYVYTGFANSDNYDALEDGAAQMLESALKKMVDGFQKQEVLSQIQTYDAGFKANPGKGKRAE